MVLQVGEIHPTSKCGNIVVTEYRSAKDVTVRFIDTGTEVVTATKEVRSGAIRDPLARTVFGVGYLDGCKGYSNNKASSNYVRWFGMLARCYDKYTKEVQPTYQQCTASESFKSFALFEEWAISSIGSDNPKWHLDKDILVKGNKVYSEDTCCFVPREINNLFVLRTNDRGSHLIGVNKSSDIFYARMMRDGKYRHIGQYDTSEEAFYAYKEAKEKHIKEVANKWKGQIDIRVYNALMSW